MVNRLDKSLGFMIMFLSNSCQASPMQLQSSAIAGASACRELLLDLWCWTKMVDTGERKLQDQKHTPHQVRLNPLLEMVRVFSQPLLLRMAAFDKSFYKKEHTQLPSGFINTFIYAYIPILQCISNYRSSLSKFLLSFHFKLFYQRWDCH